MEFYNYNFLTNLRIKTLPSSFALNKQNGSLFFRKQQAKYQI